MIGAAHKQFWEAGAGSGVSEYRKQALQNVSQEQLI